MDRVIVYPGAIPLDTDVLNVQRFAMMAVGALAEAVVGDMTMVNGLAAAPTAPASMSITIGRGSIFALSTVDATSFGSLTSDTNGLVKIGYNEGSTTEAFTAPATSGQSINYLIEAAFLESDTNAVVLPYYNSLNPAVPYTGPGGGGASQNTQRIQRVSLQVKAGAAATTGSQTTPSVDSGWVPLYVVTVAYGQTTITSSSIAISPGAPFIATPLSQVRGNNVAVYDIVGGVQMVSVNGAAYTTVGATTFPIPATGVADVELWGGGGGGGGAASSGLGGAGGGGGYCKGIVSGLTSATTVTVGAGGTAGTSTPTNGGNGGTTQFASSTPLVAVGGYGGSAETGAGAGPPGSGGSASGGNIANESGQSGSSGFFITPGTGFCAIGGASFGLGFGAILTGAVAASGQAGSFPGQGAGGALLASGGGAGANGRVVVRW